MEVVNANLIESQGVKLWSLSSTARQRWGLRNPRSLDGLTLLSKNSVVPEPSQSAQNFRRR